MTDRQTPVFVERRAYRRRRLADAARMLPVLGAVLLLIPLLWSGGDPGEPLRHTARTAWVMTYVFVVWLGLAVLSGLLSRVLSSESDAASDQSGDGTGDGEGGGARNGAGDGAGGGTGGRAGDGAR